MDATRAGLGRPGPTRPGVGYAPPQLPPTYVRRPRLEQRIEAGVEAGLVLLSAPAGSGKTLLLASWAGSRAIAPAWVSLEPEDGDAHQFWGRVLTALQGSADVPPDAVLAGLHAPPSHDQRFVRRLVEGCAELPPGSALVLDDLHVLTGTPALESLAAALRSDLGPLRMVLSTRSDPTLPLQRLRLEGRLVELRSADLCFDAPEAVRLLAVHEVSVGADQLSSLLTKTEGWAAGLRLAALSLQGSADVDAAVRDLAGDQRTVADYLMEEVLGGLSAGTERFLLDTCVVRRVCGDLADALTGRDDGQETLVRLERENLFAVALDSRRQWYRYHQLFADLLRHRLRSLDRARAAELHTRASAWFLAQGDALEAARHLSAAADWPALSRLVLRCAGAELLGTGRAALVKVLEDLPDELVTSHPEVAAAAAVGAYARYDARAVTAHVRRARELLDQLGPRDAEVTEAVLCTLEAVVAWIDSDAARQVTTAREATRRWEDVTSAEVPAMPVYRVAVAIVEAMGLLWSGDLARAEQLFTATAHLLAARSAMTPVLALHLHGSTAVLKAMGGRLREAREEIRTALSVADECGWSYLPLCATSYVAAAFVHLLEADGPGCARMIERGRACVGDLPDRHAETALGLAEARLLIANGEPAGARGCLEDLRRRLGGWSLPPFLREWWVIVEAELAIADGDAGDVADSLSQALVASGTRRPHAQARVTLARAQLRASRPQDCLETLSGLLAQPPEDHGPAAEIWVLAALAHDRLRQDAQAQSALARSLAVAAPEGIVRPFVVNGERVAALLRTHLRTSEAHRPYVERLLLRIDPRDPQGDQEPLLEPLTNRERSVLLLLPTMMSNTEIAEELHVSVNTVKVHLKGIYRKLGVSSRREAVARSRSLGLAEDYAPPATP